MSTVKFSNYIAICTRDTSCKPVCACVKNLSISYNTKFQYNSFQHSKLMLIDILRDLIIIVLDAIAS